MTVTKFLSPTISHSEHVCNLTHAVQTMVIVV
jgi:hypothetical protein